MSRKITFIVLHCSDSDLPHHDNIETITQWHTERGFTGADGVNGTLDDIGYHYFIKRDGTVIAGDPEDQIGAHVKGHNAHSLGVCLSGRSFTSFKSKQFDAARALVKSLKEKYMIPDDKVFLHRDLDPGKTCPNFSLEDFFSVG